ncbi:MAG: hypothetical protein H6Q65_1222 [Firmicutes bacterium]|nr:hypothetical protein [Bacillota bacterium]
MNISNFGIKILLDMLSNRTESQISVTANVAAKTPSEIPATTLSATEFPMQNIMNKLMNVVKEQNGLVRSLPAEVQTLVDQIFADAQPGQGIIQEGVVAMVKIPKTISSDLTALADQLSAEKLPQDAIFKQLSNVSADNLKNSVPIIKNIVNAMVAGNQSLVQELTDLLPPEIQQVVQTMTTDKQSQPSTGETPRGRAEELMVFVDRLEKTTVMGKNNSKVAELADAVKILPEKVLQESAQTIRKIAEMMNDFEPLKGSFTPKENAVATFAFPLYLEPGKTPYPAYVHVYCQDEREDSTGAIQGKETWMRFCVGTENIGIVDIVFHLYGDNQLDVKVGFANNTAADEFKEYIPDIEQGLSDAPINLATINISGRQ